MSQLGVRRIQNCMNVVTVQWLSTLLGQSDQNLFCVLLCCKYLKGNMSV